jgi:hypothetical protein
MTPLLPQLISLTLSHGDPATIAQCVSLSTSLKILSLRLHAIGDFNSDTQAIIRERIEIFRIVINGISSNNDQTILSAVIGGSQVMKKVILDGSKSRPDGRSMDRLMKILITTCDTAKVELWQENFQTGNGKVDLDP